MERGKLKDIFFIVKIIWKSSKFNLIMVLVLSFLLGLASPIMSLTWKYFLDAATLSLQTNNITGPIIMLTIFFIIMLIQSVFVRLRGYFNINLVDCLNIYITNEIMKKVSLLEMSSYENHELYDDIRHVNNNTTHKSASILGTLISIVENITAILGLAIIIFKFKPIILLICVVSSIPIMYIGAKISDKKHGIYKSRISNLRWIDQIKSLMISYEHVKEIKIYNVSDYFINKIKKINEYFLTIDKENRKKFFFKEQSIDILGEIINYLLKLFTLFNVIIHKMTIGDLTLYINSINNLQYQIKDIFHLIVNIYEDLIYIQKFKTLYNLKPNKTGDKVIFNGDFKNIELKDVSFKYSKNEKLVLKNISIKIEAGKSYSLVGLNGSGKTTLVKIILGIYDPTSGDVYVNGTNLKDIDKSSYYKYISVVFQDFIRYPLTVKENISIGNLSELENDNRIIESAKNSEAHSFITELRDGYNTNLTKYWENSTELSSGQWQKIAVSRAFMSQYNLIVLDEPTSSLDADSEYKLLNQFKSLSKEKTSILISHRLSSTVDMDKIFFLKDGKIIESGNHQQLICIEGEYYNLFTLQAKGYEKLGFPI